MTTIVLLVVVWFGIDGAAVRLGPGSGSGMIVDLQKSGYVYIVLYLLWFWFLFRYWQHRSLVSRDALNQLLDAQLPAITKAFGSQLSEKFNEEMTGDLSKREEPDKTIKLKNVSPQGGVQRAGWKSVAAEYRCTPVVVHNNTQRDMMEHNRVVHIRGRDLYWPLLKAITPVNIRHPYFTEYPKPIVFVLPVLAVTLVRLGDLIWSLR